MSTFDDNNPGLVNVADQAYPPVPATFQALPVPFEFNPALVAPPPLPQFSAGAPTPKDAFVANVGGVPPSFSQGSPTPVLPTIDISVQDLIKFPSADWTVTETGSYQTNNALGVPQPFHILAVVVIDAGLPTQAYQIFLQSPVNLYGFGLDITDMLVSFPSAAPPSAPENIPQRPIVSFNANWFLVEGYDGQGNLLTIPGFNQLIQIFIVRDGPAVTNQTNLPVINVNVPTPAAPPPPLLGTQFNFTGNFFAREEVRIPFVGSGVAAPPFLGTFEVENQSLVGQGLPANVFV